MKKILMKKNENVKSQTIKKDLISCMNNIHGNDIEHLKKVTKIKSMLDTTIVLFSKGKITDLTKETEVDIVKSHAGKMIFDDTTTINMILWRNNVKLVTLTYNPLIKFRKE